MIRLNPYKSIDFAGIKVPAITHEHNYNQARFESCHNRGIRMIPATHYAPSVPRYPLVGWSADYIDWTDETATETAQRTNIGSFSDFINKDLNNVVIADIPSLPNCEKVNMSDFGGHLTCLGSTFGDPGWDAPPSGVPEGGTVAWRQANPLYSAQQMIDNIQANKLYDKVFMTVNHPTYDVAVYASLYGMSEGLIKGFEGWNNYFSGVENKIFRDKYDDLLKLGKQLWIVAAVDWQGYLGVGNIEDLGCNVLLPGAGYDSMTKAQKEQELLNCYDEGRFYASGKMTFAIDSLAVSNSRIEIAFDTQCDTIKVITEHGEKTVINTDTAFHIVSGSNKYVRFEGWKGTDFIFTQPVFFEGKRNVNLLGVF